MHGTLQDLKIFVAAYEERSFTLAAKRVHAVQSGVSQHVKQLEALLGVQLFLRDKGRIRPTPAGDRYYQECVAVLRAYDQASRSVRSFAHGLYGEIVVGLMPTLTRCALAPALARFIDAHPNVNVRVVEGFSGTLTEQVAERKLDFAIVPAFAQVPGLRQRLIHRTHEVLVSARDCGLVHLQPVRLGELAPLKLVMPGPGNVRRQSLEAYFRANDIRIDRFIELDAMHGSLSFVGRTDWKMILPAVMLMQDADAASYTLNPVVDPPLALDLVLIEPVTAALSAAAEVFAEFVQEETLALERTWAPRPAPAGAG